MKTGTRTALIVAIVITLMIGLNLLLYVKPEPPPEDEFSGDRSSYSGRPYGSLGYYTFLEESRFPVGRWRKAYTDLPQSPETRTLFVIAPSPEYAPTRKELGALKTWVSNGGVVVIFDRTLRLELGRRLLTTGERLPAFEDKSGSIFENGLVQAALPWQPSPLFQGVKRIAVSEYATTVRLEVAPPSLPKSDAPFDDEAAEPAAAEPTTEPKDEPGLALVPLAGSAGKTFFGEIRYGKGRILCIADPYVIANNGIREGDNAAFARNIAVRTLNLTENGDGKIMFDEYHHGRRDSGKGLIGTLSYFRGTPAPWMALHLIACGVLILYTAGRRFARPLPMKKRSRASSLEFVSAMAQIQKVAESHDLAIENFYIRFHRRLCRYGGVPPTASLKDISDAVAKRSGKTASEIRALVERCTEILNGKSTTEREMLKLTRAIRTMEDELQLNKISTRS